MILSPGLLETPLAADHPVRLVEAFVARLDVSALREPVKSREGTPRHPAIDPAALVTLWLYVTVEGIGSAWELARLCQVSLRYQLICGGVSVNHHTLSDARLACDSWLDAILTASLAALLNAGAIRLETVAQDGLRGRAASGTGSFRRRPTLQRCLDEAQKRVRGLTRTPAVRRTGGSRRARAPAAAERLARVQAALAALPKEEQRALRNRKPAQLARVLTGDAEAALMKLADGGFRPAINTQLAAEPETG
jgi:transposase